MLQSAEAMMPLRKEPSLVRSQVPLHGRVLVAEDVPSVQLVLATILRHMKLEVEIAEDGLVACQMAEKSQTEGKSFDLILMDIQMPRMNGYEATRRLRRQGWRGPIVALTAHALVGDREKCLQAGCDDYIAKPITMTGLQDTLARYLGQEAMPAGQVAVEDGLTTEPADLLAGGLLGPSKVAELIDVFRGELPSRAELIEEAAQQHDRLRLLDLAHQLKGTAGTYGFDSISEAARTIYDRLRADDELKELDAAVSELVELCRQAAIRKPGSPSDARPHP
jgi:CheY-like chemotaxis protein/HPt (histidine-containing phosphotransfer) domain-containing protein